MQETIVATSAQPLESMVSLPSFALPHVAARLFDTPLLIEPRKLDTIVAVLSPRLGLPVVGQQEPTETKARTRKSYQIVNGTAVIPVMGTLVQRATRLNALSGLTSYSQLSAEFDQALNDPEVSRVLLHIDSPGGEASGLFDLTDQVKAGRAVKPITALADGMAASAAYGIAAAAGKLYVTQGSMVGSIGVRLKHLDRSQANENQGYHVTEIYAGARKVDGSPDAPLTDESRAALQQIVNDTYELFTSKVAEYRDIPQSRVKATEANVYVGGKAPVGFIDGVNTLSQLLGAEPATTEVGTMGNPVTTAELASAYPELCQQIADDAKAEAQRGANTAAAREVEQAVTADQARIKEILGLAGYTLPTLVENALFTNGGLTADKAARLFLEKKYEKTQANASAWLQDATDPAKVDPLPTEGADISPSQAAINRQLGLGTQDFLKFRNLGHQDVR